MQAIYTEAFCYPVEDSREVKAEGEQSQPDSQSPGGGLSDLDSELKVGSVFQSRQPIDREFSCV